MDGTSILVELNSSVVNRIRHMTRKSIPNETGGILIGKYDLRRQRAVVKTATAAPEDSISTPITFHRGARGLQKILDAAWSRGEYYLGEWHFHPEAVPNASTVDRDQMAAFAGMRELHCPEPLLLIAGLPKNGGAITAYAFLGELIDLRLIGSMSNDGSISSQASVSGQDKTAEKPELRSQC